MGGWSSSRLLLPVLLVLLAPAGLAGCRGPLADDPTPSPNVETPTPTSATPTGTGSGTATATSTTTSRTSTTSSTAPPPRRRVAWVPPGPASPGTPFAQARWYGRLFERTDCQGYLDVVAADEPGGVPDRVRTLFLGAGHACLAVQSNAAAQWRAAETAVARVGGSQGLGCLAREVWRLLGALVAEHRAHPGLRVRTGGADTSGGTPARPVTACPFRATGFAPAEAFAGDSVTIEGTSLWDVQKVWFGQVSTDQVEQVDATHVSAVVPESVAPGQVRIRLESSYGVQARAPGRFTITGAPSTSSTSTEGGGGP